MEEEGIEMKRAGSMPIPEAENESLRLRIAAKKSGKCANCGKELPDTRRYYCDDDCRYYFYRNHPTSWYWPDVRARVLEDDEDKCVKCGKPASEVDHIVEIWEGGREFDLDNLQSLCHVCHVMKTTQGGRRRKLVKVGQRTLGEI